MPLPFITVSASKQVIQTYHSVQLNDSRSNKSHNYGRMGHNFTNKEDSGRVRDSHKDRRNINSSINQMKRNNSQRSKNNHPNHNSNNNRNNNNNDTGILINHQTIQHHTAPTSPIKQLPSLPSRQSLSANPPSLLHDRWQHQLQKYMNAVQQVSRNKQQRDDSVEGKGENNQAQFDKIYEIGSRIKSIALKAGQQLSRLNNSDQSKQIQNILLSKSAPSHRKSPIKPPTMIVKPITAKPTIAIKQSMSHKPNHAPLFTKLLPSPSLSTELPQPIPLFPIEIPRCQWIRVGRISNQHSLDNNKKRRHTDSNLHHSKSNSLNHNKLNVKQIDQDEQFELAQANRSSRILASFVCSYLKKKKLVGGQFGTINIQKGKERQANSGVISANTQLKQSGLEVMLEQEGMVENGWG